MVKTSFPLKRSANMSWTTCLDGKMEKMRIKEHALRALSESET